MFSKRLVALAGIAASFLWVSAAHAATLVTIGLQEASENGGAITTEASGADSAIFGGAYGPFNINLVTGLTGTNTFNTSSNNSASGAGTLKVYVTLQGLTEPIGALAVLSSFTENIIDPTISSVTEATYFDPANGLFELTTPLASHVFSGVGLAAASSLDLIDILSTDPFSVTALYTIVATGAGTSNSTINVSAVTPIPGTLPLLAGGLGLLWAVGKKRKARRSVQQPAIG